MSAVTALLNCELTGYRDVLTENGTGGYTAVRTPVGTAEARVVPAGMSEAVLARSGTGPQQGEAVITHLVYFEPDTDAQRLDDWEDPERGRTYRLVALVQPSSYDVYLKAQAVEQQAAPDEPVVA